MRSIIVQPLPAFMSVCVSVLHCLFVCIKPVDFHPLPLACLYIHSSDQTVASQMQITLSRLTEQGTEVLQRFRIYCDISRGVRGGTGLTLHSGIKLRNSLESWLAVGVYQNWPGNAERYEPDCIQVCAVLCRAELSRAVLCAEHFAYSSREAIFVHASGYIHEEHARARLCLRLGSTQYSSSL